MRFRRLMNQMENLHPFVNDQLFGFIVIYRQGPAAVPENLNEQNFLTDSGKYNRVAATLLPGTAVKYRPDNKNYPWERSKFTNRAWYFSCGTNLQTLVAIDKLRFDFNL